MEANRESMSLIEAVFLSSEMLLYPNVTAATAMWYCHKYNVVMGSKASHENVADKIVVCSAILFLAGKSTENIRRIREVLNVARYSFGFRSDTLELKKYQDIKVSIVEKEHFLLRLIGFAAAADVPHAHLLNIARYLKLTSDEVKYSYMFLNDSLFNERITSTLPGVTASSCIYLGVKFASQSFVKKQNNAAAINNQRWWTKLNINEDELFAASDWIVETSLSRMR